MSRLAGQALARRPDEGTGLAAECSAAWRQAAFGRPLGMQHAHSPDRDAARCIRGRRLFWLPMVSSALLLPPGCCCQHCLAV